MPNYKTPKYSVTRTQEITMRTLGVLNDSSSPMTIEEICRADTCLVGITPQKMARVLSELNEAGFVQKKQSRAKGHMVYGTIQTRME